MSPEPTGSHQLLSGNRRGGRVSLAQLYAAGLHLHKPCPSRRSVLQTGRSSQVSRERLLACVARLHVFCTGIVLRRRLLLSTVNVSRLFFGLAPPASARMPPATNLLRLVIPASNEPCLAVGVPN